MSKRVEFDAATARILLDLADNRKEVQTDSQGPRLSLIVPDYLWERYEKYQATSEQTANEKKKGK